MKCGHTCCVISKGLVPKNPQMILHSSLQGVHQRGFSLVAQTVNASAYNAGDQGSIPRPGRSPGEGNGTPL